METKFEREKQYYERKRVINTHKKLQIQNENTEKNDI